MSLGHRLARHIQNATFDRVTGEGLANAEVNRGLIEQSVLTLASCRLGEGDSAIVVGAGASLHRRGILERLAASKYRGTIVVADAVLGGCLRNGIVPHVVVSVDPHPTRIVRWFGDPSLTEARDDHFQRHTTQLGDEYFERQEFDPAIAENEMKANRELVRLVDEHGPAIKLAVATSAAPTAVERCRAAGMALFWWNPMYDDYDSPTSITRRLQRSNRLPCLNGGGNVGTAAWVIAQAVLEKRTIGLIGMDFSYPPGRPYWKTQYGPDLKQMFGDRFEEAFIHIENPHVGETWFTDPAYYWFRDVFFEMVRRAGCRTFNCTEGGILFGNGVEVASIEDFVGTLSK
ncbi:MAG: DUF115 domain-containing protein [Candidatus Rokubacteria bacterium]|nr:DUF115 domain-containing protein [Candidatus Rokubacteria bacterium]